MLQEIDRDIQNNVAEEVWNLNQLVAEFSELCTFLNDVQDAVYSKTENVTNWALRAVSISFFVNRFIRCCKCRKTQIYLTGGS